VPSGYSNNGDFTLDLAIEIIRWCGIAVCIYVFFKFIHVPVITIKHDVVEQKAEVPVDPTFREEWDKELKKRNS